MRTAFALLTLVGLSCSCSEKKSKEEPPRPPKTSPGRVRAAQELLARCRQIEPRIPACDRLQAVVTRDDDVPPSVETGLKPASVAVAQPFSPKGASLRTHGERTTHARAMLEKLQSVATSGMRELEDSEATTRDEIVIRLSTQIEHASKELLSVGDQLSKSTRSSLLSLSNDAADAVLEVKAWIGSRRPNAAMLVAILASITHLDAALVQLGVAPVGKRPRPRPKSGEADEANREVGQATLNASLLENAISAELDYRKIEVTQ